MKDMIVLDQNIVVRSECVRGRVRAYIMYYACMKIAPKSPSFFRKVPTVVCERLPANCTREFSKISIALLELEITFTF